MFTQQDAIKARVDDTAICRPNSRACGTERERERERERAKMHQKVLKF
jgi:hypothetical protein